MGNGETSLGSTVTRRHLSKKDKNEAEQAAAEQKAVVERAQVAAERKKREEEAKIAAENAAKEAQERSEHEKGEIPTMIQEVRDDFSMLADLDDPDLGSPGVYPAEIQALREKFDEAVSREGKSTTSFSIANVDDPDEIRRIHSRLSGVKHAVRSKLKRQLRTVLDNQSRRIAIIRGDPRSRSFSGETQASLVKINGALDNLKSSDPNLTRAYNVVNEVRSEEQIYKVNLASPHSPANPSVVESVASVV